MWISGHKGALMSIHLNHKITNGTQYNLLDYLKTTSPHPVWDSGTVPITRKLQWNRWKVMWLTYSVFWHRWTLSPGALQLSTERCCVGIKSRSVWNNININFIQAEKKKKYQSVFNTILNSRAVSNPSELHPCSLPRYLSSKAASYNILWKFHLMNKI